MQNKKKKKNNNHNRGCNYIHHDNRFLTAHSVNRFAERTEMGFKEQEKNAGLAFSRGYKIRHFKEPFYSYLNSKQLDGGRFSIRVWEDYVYVFDNILGRLLTIYPVPSEYIPITNYIIRNGRSGTNGINGETNYDVHPCLIKLTSPEGEVGYICECDDFTSDIAYALEFRSEQRANNYIKNNNNIKIMIRNGWDYELVDMSD